MYNLSITLKLPSLPVNLKQETNSQLEKLRPLKIV